MSIICFNSTSKWKCLSKCPYINTFPYVTCASIAIKNVGDNPSFFKILPFSALTHWFNACKKDISSFLSLSCFPFSIIGRRKVVSSNPILYVRYQTPYWYVQGCPYALFSRKDSLRANFNNCVFCKMIRLIMESTIGSSSWN